MGRISTALIAFSVLALGSIEIEACSKNYNFDYILLATQWPETFCETTHCVQHQDIWAIHGAWPENNDGSWPQDCCTNHTYNGSLLKSIEPELIQHWKTLKSGGTNDQFWNHEYTKHGTCAIQSPLMKDEFNYFKSTLEAFKKLQIDEWLNKAGIVPSATKLYPVAEFHAAIKKNLGHSAQIDCVIHKKKQAPAISQINFCLNKVTLEPFDCPLKDRGCTHGSVGYHSSKQ